MTSETTLVWPDSFLWVFHLEQRGKDRSEAQILRESPGWRGCTLSKGTEGALSTQTCRHAPFRNFRPRQKL